MLGELDGALRRRGSFEAIIDLTAIEQVIDHWATIHPHLRDGGAFVHPVANRSSARRARAWSRGLAHHDDPRIVAMTGPVHSRRGVVMVQKRGTDHLAVGYAEVDELLRERSEPLQVDVFAELPAGSHRHRAIVTSHPVDLEVPALDEHLDHPAQRLRHYQGRVVVAPGSLVYTEHMVLPDSFRHYAWARLTGRATKSMPGFVRLDRKRRPQEHLQGDFYLLDAFYPGHFGHHMTETISRLWGWDEAKRRLPGLKALMTRRPGDDRAETFERRTFEAYGIGADDLVEVRHPVEVDSLVAAPNLWHNQRPHFAHPVLVDTWRRIGDTLAVAPDQPVDRLFVSRRETKRGVHNLRDVEDYFVRHGFTVVHPEDFSVGRQAGLFQEARVIAGIAGSGMFNLAFARRLERLIVLSSDSYTARNEHLFSALLGGRLDYFWSTADIPHPPGQWTQEAFKSPWTFDFPRHGAALDAVMSELPTEVADT